MDKKQAIDYLTSPSFYGFEEGDHIEFPAINSLKINYGDIEEAVIKKIITITDAFYVLGVAKLIHCTMPMLQKWLKMYKLANPEKNLQYEDTKALTSRLTALVKNGLLRIYYIKDTEKNQLSTENKIYSVTQRGMLAAKEMLDIDSMEKYNAWPGIRPAHKVLRHLDGINAVSYLTQSKYCVGIDCERENFDTAQRVAYKVLGEAKFEKDVNGKKLCAKVLVEPVHTTVDFPNVADNKEEYFNVAADRIRKLIEKRAAMLNAKDNQYTDIFILLVVDGMPALKLISEQLKKINAQVEVPHEAILFTSYNLLAYSKNLKEGFIAEKDLVFPDSWIFEDK